MDYGAQGREQYNMVGNWALALELLNEKPELMRTLDMIWKGSTGLRIRSMCANYIEQQPWMDCAKNQVLGMEIFNRLIQDAQSVAKQCGDVVQQHEMLKDCERLEKEWSIAKIEFASKMVSSLNSEKVLLESCIPDPDDRRRVDVQESNMAEENAELLAEINNVQHQLMMGNIEIEQLERTQAECHRTYVEWQEEKKSLNSRLQTEQGDKVKTEKSQQELLAGENKSKDALTNNFRLRQAAVRQHEKLVHKLKPVMEYVWQDVENWKDALKQAISCITKPKDNIVDVLEPLCRNAAQLLLDVLQQNKRIEAIMTSLQYSNSTDSSPATLIAMQELLESILQTHLNTVFVVDKCPRTIRIVTSKSISEIPLRVRLLGGDAFHMLPTVQTWMFQDKHLQDLQNSFDPNLKICDVVNGKKMMEQIRRSGQIYVSFSSVSLQRVQTAPKCPEKLVAENMYAMVFTTSIIVLNKKYTLRTMSLPIVSVTHVMQECLAKGFLIWDAAFSEPDTRRKPFVNPENVKWEQLAPVLSAYFKEHTKRPLEDSQLNYLASILFREKKMMNFSHRVVSKSLVFKDALYKKPSRNTGGSRGSTRGSVAGADNDNKSFPFWKWFYACANLVKEKINREWIGLNGVKVIEGFMSKQQAESKLLPYELGTFLLRFSERNIEDSNKGHPCGCLTIAVVQIDPDTNKEKVFHVKDHLSAEDLQKYGLTSILNALYVTTQDGTKAQLCAYLYPQHPFNETFLDNQPDSGASDADGYLKSVRTIEIFLSETQRLRHNPSLPPQSPMSSMAPSPSYPTMLENGDDSQPAYGPTPARIARVQPFENPAKMRRSVDSSNGVATGIAVSSSAMVSPMSPQQPPLSQQQFINYNHGGGQLVYEASLSSASPSHTSVPITTAANDLFQLTSEVRNVTNIVDLGGGSVRSQATVAPIQAVSASSSVVAAPMPQQQQQSMFAEQFQQMSEQFSDQMSEQLSDHPTPTSGVERMFTVQHDMVAHTHMMQNDDEAANIISMLDINAGAGDAAAAAEEAASFFDIELPIDVDTEE